MNAAVRCVLCCISLLAILCAGCDVERRKSDAELGLTPQQAAGRHIYDQYCNLYDPLCNLLRPWGVTRQSPIRHVIVLTKMLTPCWLIVRLLEA